MKTSSKFTHYALLAFLTLMVFNLETQALSVDTTPITHSVVARNGVRVPFLIIDIVTDQSPLSLQAINLKKTGLSSNDDIDKVWASGRFGHSFQASVDNDDLAHIRFFRRYYIPPYTQDQIIIYANLDAQGSNRTIGFSLINLESEAGPITSLSPTRSQTLSSQRSNLTPTSSYQLPRPTFDPLTNSGRILIGRDNRLGRFRLKNPSHQTITLDHIRLRNRGTARLNDMFETLKLKDNHNWTIAQSQTIMRDYVDFDLNGQKLEPGESLTLSVWGRALYGRANRTIQLVLDEQEDLGAYVGRDRYPTFSAYRNQNQSPISIRTGGSYLNTRSANRYITTRRDLWNRDYNPGEKQITFLAQRLTFKAPVYLDKVRAMVASGSRLQTSESNFQDSFQDFRLYINDQYIDQSDTFTQEDGRTFVEFSVGEIFTGGTDFRVVGNISRNAQKGDRLKLRIEQNRSFPQWHYVR